MRSAERMTPAQLVADDLALVIDLHHAGEDEAINLRSQGTDIRGEFERQHGHSAIGKIH